VPRCADCPPPPLAWARAPLLYTGAVRRALIRLKFSGLSTVAEALAPWMVEALARSPPPGPSSGEPVVLTWVPLGRRRRRRRGYDQAEVLARQVGGLTGWAVAPLLERTAETRPQARRPGRERRRALRGAFRARGPVPGRVVLVDDVLTSGATAAECARVLIGAGAAEVGALAAARALNGPLPARCYTAAWLRPGSVVARERFSR
jgi:competence protein ComFC